MPVTSVPMKLPSIRLSLPKSASSMPSPPFAEITLADFAVVPPIVSDSLQPIFRPSLAVAEGLGPGESRCR